jgi:hypothetical protein
MIQKNAKAYYCRMEGVFLMFHGNLIICFEGSSRRKEICN